MKFIGFILKYMYCTICIKKNYIKNAFSFIIIEFSTGFDIKNI